MADTQPESAPVVLAVHRNAVHDPSKQTEPTIRLLAGLGVEGDAHAGERVQHRSRVRRDPTQPNLRQVHLLHDELLERLRGEQFRVDSGTLGENVTTRGLDLLALPTGTRLHLGAEAIVEVTGLRNPCNQLNGIQPGLLEAVIERRPDGSLVRKAGIMGIVLVGGEVRAGDAIGVERPAEPWRELEPV